MLYVASISSRDEFGRLLQERGLVHWAVEVGTHRAVFAATLLSSWPGHLFCVDPWSVPFGYERQAGFLAGGGDDREADLAAARYALIPFIRRTTMVRKLSADAVCDFRDGALDFAYLDGDHEPPCVEQDLYIWWPKLKDGGILAGHDFMCPGEVGGGWGAHIQPAVLSFAYARGLDLHLVVEADGRPWSYYMEKG